MWKKKLPEGEGELSEEISGFGNEKKNYKGREDAEEMVNI